METEDNKPKLELVAIDGKRRKVGDEKLTAKQEAFCQNIVAGGMTNTDAYKAAYDSTGMKDSTIHQEACRVAAHPKVAARIAVLIEEKRQKNSMFTDRQREKYSDRVWRNLWAMIDNPETPPAVKANLLSLGAKAAGMLTDQLKIENTSSDSQSIEKELIERLQRLKSA